MESQKVDISTADYFPYGKVLREYVGTEKERYLTTQHERDEETGLDNRGARYYDADIARFLSLDPLATEFPEWSAYNYVMGNPLSLIDPSGRSPEDPNDKNKSDQESSDIGAPPIKTVNFGLFSMTIRKGLRSEVTGLPKFGVKFSLNYTLARETSDKKVWKSEKFVFSRLTMGGASETPNTGTFNPIRIGGATTNSSGQTMDNFGNGPTCTFLFYHTLNI